jgi:hypothetical protein
MRAILLRFFILVFLLTTLPDFCAGEMPAGPVPIAQSLSEYFEPGHLKDRDPLQIKQVIGLAIAGLSSVVILLFVFSFLMGPGEELRDKMSEASDPFFTIVAILLVVLFLATVQAYYSEILDWLRTFVSSG